MKSKRTASGGGTGSSRQGGLMPLWSDYSTEDVGKLATLCLSAGRGVLLSTTPSGDLLTARIYHGNGHTPLYGRSIGELTGRFYKLFGRSITRSDRAPIANVPHSDGVAYGSVEYLVKVLGWSPERATAFDEYLAPTRARVFSNKDRERLTGVWRIPPPPL